MRITVSVKLACVKMAKCGLKKNQMHVFLEIEYVFTWGWSLVSRTLAENMRRPGFGSSSAFHKTGHGGTWL